MENYDTIGYFILQSPFNSIIQCALQVRAGQGLEIALILCSTEVVWPGLQGGHVFG